MNGVRAKEHSWETALVGVLRTEPLIPAEHDAYPDIARRRTTLARRLRDDRGAHLVVTPKYARVVAPASGPALTPRAYACLALSVAALADAPTRLLTSELAERVTTLAGRAGIDPTAEGDDAWRYALVAALEALGAWNVVSEVDGRLAEYAIDPAADVLLGVDARLARAMVKGDRG